MESFRLGDQEKRSLGEGDFLGGAWEGKGGVAKKYCSLFVLQRLWGECHADLTACV